MHAALIGGVDDRDDEFAQSCTYRSCVDITRCDTVGDDVWDGQQACSVNTLHNIKQTTTSIVVML